MFYGIKGVMGLRISPAIEDAGIDLAYHGIGSYPEFIPEGKELTPVFLREVAQGAAD
jgi:hypothetical protein